MPKPKITARQVLTFWFALERPGKRHDHVVREVLGELYELAATHQLDDWVRRPHDRLALILLLDQVPRHLYRQDGRAYATDLHAQAAAERFFARQDWQDFTPLERYYAALPLLHAEDAALQRRVNPVMHTCAEAIPELSFMGRIADLYLETIERFGHFPHRNALRGRVSTPEEERFLEEEWYPRRRRVLPSEE
ncbi:MAG TPA: DUF924 family protein [bacterium]|nr:DUF924 family protein [bacterium]HKJ91651.1 DUF924 family protein [Longimicrobiales bacterium]